MSLLQNATHSGDRRAAQGMCSQRRQMVKQVLRNQGVTRTLLQSACKKQQRGAIQVCELVVRVIEEAQLLRNVIIEIVRSQLLLQ